MKAAVMERRGEPLVVRDIPEPADLGDDKVLIRVEACGVCHGDVSIADGDWDWVPIPRIIGHEVVGVVEQVGRLVDQARVGSRVGVGWLNGSCGRCTECRTGQQVMCEVARAVTGTDVDGGYATYTTAPSDFAVDIPAALSPAEAAPLLCAGLTVFNGLRAADLQPGARVAVVGVGGLGHLAIQYAQRGGADVVAVSGTESKEQDARRFGATEFVVARDGAVGEALAATGPVDIAVVTGTGTAHAGSLLPGLRAGGTLVLLGLGRPFEVDPAALCMRNLRVVGSLTGTAHDMAQALRFAARTGIRPEVEQFPLDQVNEALGKLRSGDMRYRGVLTMQ